MQEPQRDVTDTALAPAEREAVHSLLLRLLLGPNENIKLPQFQAYAPIFNLLPAKSLLPLWVIPAISLGLALAFVAPIAIVVRLGVLEADRKIAQSKQRSAALLTQHAQYDAATKLLETVQNQKNLLDKVMGRGPRWSQLLDRLRHQLPDGVELTGIQADPRGKVVLSGVSKDIWGPGAFMLYLRASGHFTRPKLFHIEKIQPRSVSGIGLLWPPNRYDFEISVRTAVASLLQADSDEPGAKSSDLGVAAGTAKVPAKPARDSAPPGASEE